MAEASLSLIHLHLHRRLAQACHPPQRTFDAIARQERAAMLWSHLRVVCLCSGSGTVEHVYDTLPDGTLYYRCHAPAPHTHTLSHPLAISLSCCSCCCVSRVAAGRSTCFYLPRVHCKDGWRERLLPARVVRWWPL